MSTKQVIPRGLAHADIVEALDHYLEKAGEAVALKFIDALEQVYGRIARHPASGSSRYAHALNLQGLKVWPLKRYPHLVIYMERDNHIEIWHCCILSVTFLAG